MRGVRGGGCLVQTLVTIMVDRLRKILKWHWLKHPWKSPKKQNLDQKVTDSKSHICLYFNFGFSSRKSQSQQNLAKMMTHFAIQFHSENLTHCTSLNSLNIVKNILPQHSQKPKNTPTHSKNFQQTSFWFVSEKTFALLSRRSRTAFSSLLENKCLNIPVNLRKNILVPET